MFDPKASPEAKIEAAIKILEKEIEKEKQIDENLALINVEISRISNNADYYDTLEAKSRKLQNKVSEIIKHFIFDKRTSDRDLLEAIQYFKEKNGIPDHITIIAGILGYGCNIGTNKIAKLSKDINASKLMNAIKMRFILDNIQNANNKILTLMGKFEISRLFKKHKNKTHTASDGQKFVSTVDSVFANKSFKYFGMNDGLVINSFIDDTYRLFYSTVISPAEREAAYTMDGLLHNEVVQSDIHSTDTHGYNEIIFAVTHLLGIPKNRKYKKTVDKKQIV